MRSPFGRKNPASNAETSPSAPSLAQEKLDAARQSLSAGDPEEALRALTHGFAADASCRELYLCARDVLQQLNAPAEANLFKAALKNFVSSEPFSNLGYHFIDAGHDRLAIPFLERVSQIDPQQSVIDNELAIALCGQFQAPRALEILDALPEPRPFWVKFQRAWAAILCNRRDGLNDWLQEARKYLQETDEIPEAQKSSVEYALNKIGECLERLESVPNPRPRVDDWHFIQYGAVVLDLMDDRIVEDGMNVAGGRHVASWAAYDDIKRMLVKSHELLSGIGRLPQQIIAVPDRDSLILACACAQIFGVPWMEAAEEGEIAQENSLVVAGDALSIEVPDLSQVLAGQTMFALSMNWLERVQVTPDVCGVLAQSYNLPWQGGAMQFDPETEQMTESEADTRSIEEIANEIVAVEIEADENWMEQKTWFVERRTLLKAGHGGAARLPFNTDSPIPGSYFC